MRHLLLLMIAFAVTGLAGPAFAQKDPAPKEPKPAAGAPDKPAGAPDKADPAAAGAKRSPEQIQGDLQKAGGELQAAIGSPETLLDADKRKAAAAKAVPAIKRMSTLLDEIAQVQPEAKAEIENAKMEFTTLLSLFGDADAAKAIDAVAKGTGPKAIDAKTAQQFVAYLTAGKDEAAQLKVLDEVQKIAKANPTSDQVASTLIKMSKMGAASKAVSDRAENILVTDLTGEGAKQYGERIKGERKMRDSVGKPVEITGMRVDGKTLSTKEWKGKVILVDFWATWCGPCLAELPRVKKAYLAHHAKGLEILGVSCDSDAESLKGFLDKNKDMPWPQLFDAAQNPKLEWHPIAKEWGINGIPTMFLIDKKGILRSVEARGEFEEMIPKLLEEKE